jgi:hypothetical protein
MDKNMGRPSDYKSGPSGFKGAELPASAEPKTPGPPIKPAGTTDQVDHAALRDHLRKFLGIADKEPVPNGGLDALNKGLKDAE